MNEQVELPNYIVNEDVRAAKRHDVIKAINAVPLAEQVALITAINELAKVYFDTAKVRFHQGKIDRAIAYNKTAEEIVTVAQGAILNLEDKVKQLWNK